MTNKSWRPESIQARYKIMSCCHLSGFRIHAATKSDSNKWRPVSVRSETHCYYTVCCPLPYSGHCLSSQRAAREQPPLSAPEQTLCQGRGKRWRHQTREWKKTQLLFWLREEEKTFLFTALWVYPHWKADFEKNVSLRRHFQIILLFQSGPERW